MSDDREACNRLVGRFFAAVSFAEGSRPPYGDLHEVLFEGAKLIKNSGEAPEVATVVEFISPRQSLVDAGELTAFEEIELGGTTELFGNVAHRFSRYAKRGVMNGVPFEGRGAISTQFIRTRDGWRISAMAWDDERPGLALPDPGAS